MKTKQQQLTFRILVVFALAFISTIGGWSQAKAPRAAATKPAATAQAGGPILKLFQELNLSSAELDRLDALVLESQKTIQNANAAISVDKTQLTQSLLKPGVSLKDVEPIIRASIEEEYRIRLAQVDRQLKIRALLGDQRWAVLARLGRQLVQREKAAETLPEFDDPLYVRTLNLLRNLGGLAGL